MEKISIYIHYPFCKSKCPYCDFNSYCNIKIEEEDLLQAYLNEINYYKNILNNKEIETIYFGGGTPTLMSENILFSILNELSKLAIFSKNIEITSEANPNSADFEKLYNFNKIGINRLSIGVQSLYDEDLKLLGRIHNKKEAIETIKNTQKIFKDKYSIDLIYSRPNQNIDDWKKELIEAIKLSPFHLSLYQLIIEKGTVFYKNKISVPNDELSNDLYSLTGEILEKNNINFYEISNYAKNGYECKHNLIYWQNGCWLGIGAGAHSRLNIKNNRYALQNLKNPIKWVEKCLKNKNGCSKKEKLTKEGIIEEFVLMGLRTKNGINIKDLQKNINCDSFYKILNEKNIKFLIENNFIDGSEKKIKIKKNNFILLNSIIEKVLF